MNLSLLLHHSSLSVRCSRQQLCQCSRSINTTFKLPSSKVLSILIIHRSIVPAEGYEDRRHYVYQLHKQLYGMKDSPRGWSKLFTSVCLKYGFSLLKSDECVFVKIVPNTKSGKSASTFSAVLDTLTNVPEHDRIYKDCPYESCLIILCSYVDDILAFTNCQSLADDFLAYCNNRFTMTCDGEAHWYLSVKYTRDPSGAVSASQELYIDKILKRWGMES